MHFSVFHVAWLNYRLLFTVCMILLLQLHVKGKWSNCSKMVKPFIKLLCRQLRGVKSILYYGKEDSRDLFQGLITNYIVIIQYCPLMILQYSVHKQKDWLRQDFMPEILKELIFTPTSLGGIAQEHLVLIYRLPLQGCQWQQDLGCICHASGCRFETFSCVCLCMSAKNAVNFSVCFLCSII